MSARMLSSLVWSSDTCSRANDWRGAQDYADVGQQMESARLRLEILAHSSPMTIPAWAAMADRRSLSVLWQEGCRFVQDLCAW